MIRLFCSQSSFENVIKLSYVLSILIPKIWDKLVLIQYNVII